MSRLKNLDSMGVARAWNIVKGYVDSLVTTRMDSKVRDVKYFTRRNNFDPTTEILPSLNIGDFFAQEQGGDVICFRVTTTANGTKTFVQDMDNSCIYLFPATQDTLNVWAKAIYVSGGNGLNPV